VRRVNADAARRLPDTAEVIDLSREREGRKLKSGRELASSRSSTKRTAAFDSAVARLEAAQRQRLYGSGLDECLAAFAAEPEGFARCASDVFADWNGGAGEIRKPLSVFCKRIGQGQHLLPPELDELELEPRSPACEECNLRGGLHVDGCSHANGATDPGAAATRDLLRAASDGAAA
jgi:hypothetical protein